MYCARKVTDDLYWVGADDHRPHLFENIHPVPRGVSYNTYLLLDEQPVLFDTIDWSAYHQLQDNLDHLLGDKPLDWLVVNHMEPDYRASMKQILRHYPKVKVISTRKSFMLMRQFDFHPDEHECAEVREGDTHCFGKRTVTLVSAPMVHWLEAMVTFGTTNGALFSADAFGSFIALDGKLFADEVNFDRDWIDEARRYLTNIVGKYGPHIQLLLGKVAGVLDQIKFICPLHGPVWCKDLGYSINKHDKWSRYEPEEKGVMIAYTSMHGNIKVATQALAAGLYEKGITNVSVHDVSNIHVSYLISEAFKYSHIVLTSVTYNLGIYPVMENFLEDVKALNLQNRTFAFIENGSWAHRSGDLMQKFIDEEMGNMAVLSKRLSMASSLSDDKAVELDALVDTSVDSIQA